MSLILLLAIGCAAVAVVLCFEFFGTHEPIQHALGWFATSFLLYLISLVVSGPVIGRRRGE